jgi:hypothetical protein
LFFHSCLSLFLSCFVLPLLPFHIITILLLFVLSFYISFLHTFSSHFSSPSSFVSFCRLFSGSGSYYSLSFILSFFHMFSQFGLTTSVPSHSSVVVSFSLNVCFADVMS